MIIHDDRKTAGLILGKLEPQEGKIEEMDEAKEHLDAMPEESREALISIAQEAMDAIKADDAHAFAEALYAFFCISDEQPHEEGPHESEDDSGEFDSYK